MRWKIKHASNVRHGVELRTRAVRDTTTTCPHSCPVQMHFSELAAGVWLTLYSIAHPLPQGGPRPFGAYKNLKHIFTVANEYCFLLKESNFKAVLAWLGTRSCPYGWNSLIQVQQEHLEDWGSHQLVDAVRCVAQYMQAGDTCVTDSTAILTRWRQLIPVTPQWQEITRHVGRHLHLVRHDVCPATLACLGLLGNIAQHMLMAMYHIMILLVCCNQQSQSCHFQTIL